MSRLIQRSLRDRSETAVAGHGIRLRLASGKTVIDGSGGAAVACIGHGNKRVAAAMAEQAGRMAYAHTGFFTSEPAEALADLLLADEPGGLSHAFFVSSGSEAMEAAIKLARQFFIEAGQPRRTQFIARRQSYHGTTLGALSAGGHLARRAPYEPLLGAAFSRVSPIITRIGTRATRSTSDAWPPSLRPSSSGLARKRSRPSAPSRSWGRRRDASRRRRATSPPCGRCATGTARC